ncbi:ComEC/Rec2 family competence protein [Chthonobacter albigriseus]|uniref:ComEC/Rec2 family competence protein n=1 Tax=Chthonobacter albigriseus TaxID=1683161 RepID=UPI0015EF60A4|nr:ComEC/Rec2 family competence protein [Chthonobacter albigriseus]
MADLAAADLGKDLEHRRGFLWLPVLFATAAGIRLEWMIGPAPAPVLLVMMVAAAAALALRRRGGLAAALATLALVAAAGVLAADCAAAWADAPRLLRQRTATIFGHVETVEDRAGRGLRLILRVHAMDPAPGEGTPKRVRVTVRGLDAPPVVGAPLRMLARLSPPTAPLVPGGYDFARAAWFERIGAVGFSLGAPVLWSDAPDLPRDLATWGPVERLRQHVSARVREIVPGDSGAIAAALLVGDRGAIDDDTDEAMRTSGLSHILSISGLHMALVSASLFLLVRFVLAAIPPIALRYPVKQWAALAALAGNAGYLLVSGMGVPAERSAIMVGLGLVAIIADRKPFSLRVVAVSAFVVFALSPSAVLEPGAQMSFASVVALIAGYEALSARMGRTRDSGDISWIVRVTGKVALWIGASLLTSLIAGLATFPIALYHFNRVAPLGLVANLAATPLVTFLIMPMAVVTAIAMPLGLERLPLTLMGWGIDGLVLIAEQVAAWTPRGGTFGRPPVIAVLAMVAGGLWLCLWTGRQRLAGLPAIALGLALVPFATLPHVIVDGEGRRALVTLPDGTIRILGDADDFQTEIWLAVLGDARKPSDPSLVRGVFCDGEACILLADDPGGIAEAALIKRPMAFLDECHRARLVVTRLVAPPWCHALTTVVDGAVLQRTGTRTYRTDLPVHPAAPSAGDRTVRSNPDAPIVLEPLDQAIDDPPAPWHRWERPQ